MPPNRWTIEFLRRAEKDYENLDKANQQRIITQLRLLAENSPNCDVKKLKVSPGVWRLRVGRYRVFFEKEQQLLKILVIKIARRSDTTYS